MSRDRKRHFGLVELLMPRVLTKLRLRRLIVLYLHLRETRKRLSRRGKPPWSATVSGFGRGQKTVVLFAPIWADGGQ